MKPAMYLFINKGLRMSPGKIAAQAGHAAVEAALLSHHWIPQPDLQPYDPVVAEKLQALWDGWRTGLHYAKYVMEARDSAHLRDIERYLRDRGFRTALIIDEGHTEIDPIQPTALGVALVDKDDPHTAATFSSFKLYREPRPEVEASEGTWPPQAGGLTVKEPDPSDTPFRKPHMVDTYCPKKVEWDEFKRSIRNMINDLSVR